MLPGLFLEYLSPRGLFKSELRITNLCQMIVSVPVRPSKLPRHGKHPLPSDPSSPPRPHTSARSVECRASLAWRSHMLSMWLPHDALANHDKTYFATTSIGTPNTPELRRVGLRLSDAILAKYSITSVMTPWGFREIFSFWRLFCLSSLMGSCKWESERSGVWHCVAMLMQCSCSAHPDFAMGMGFLLEKILGAHLHLYCVRANQLQFKVLSHRKRVRVKKKLVTLTSL